VVILRRGEPFLRSSLDCRSRRPRLDLLALLSITILCVVGCGPFFDEENVQNRADVPAGQLGAGTIVGQSFGPQCAGLTEVDVQIAIFPAIPVSAGRLVLSLSDVPADGIAPRPIATEDILEASLQPNQWVALRFRPLEESAGRTYLFRAETSDAATSAISLWATDHPVAPLAGRTLNSKFVPGALVYQAFCDQSPLMIARDTGQAVGRLAPLWAIELALCLVPGLALTRWLQRDEQDPAAILGLGAGWSVLLAPLALGAATPVRAGSEAAAALLVFGSAGLVWDWWRRRRRFPVPTLPRSAIAIIATLAALMTRAALVRGLVLPMWVDSVQHSYVVQLIHDTGGVPTTYGALLPAEVFDYHFGFQTLAAFGTWLVGAAPADAVLVTGQVLGALICPATYLLARDLTGSRRAAAVAALLVALVTTQPAYYVTWGRYPELAGLVALPTAYRALRQLAVGRFGLGHAIPAVAASAAMVLVHPRVADLLVLLLAASLVVDLASPGGAKQTLWGAARIALAGALGLMLITPWISRLWIAHRGLLPITGTGSSGEFPLGLATAGNDRWLLGLALVGLVVGLARRDRPALVILLWSGLAYVVANPDRFHLPFQVFLDNPSIAIVAFLPIVIACGYLADWVVTSAGWPRWPSSARLVGGILAVALALSQIGSLLTVVNPCCLIARSADLAALAWVRENTPPDARFLIDGYRWQPQIWAGTDAGYWLPVLAQRATNLPPPFYATGPSSVVVPVDALAEELDRSAGDPAAVARVAARAGAHYVFVGARGGPLDPGRLVASGQFRAVFAEGGAWVLEVTGNATDSRVTVTDTTPVVVGMPRL
jgi:hypothetical protein